MLVIQNPLRRKGPTREEHASRSGPDVDDECVAVIADGVQRPSCADVARIASEAAKGRLDKPRALQST